MTGLGLIFSIAFHVGVTEPRPPPKPKPLHLGDQTSVVQKNGFTENNGQLSSQKPPKIMTWKKWLKKLEFYKVSCAKNSLQ